jgi:hypothetical protein
MFHAREKQRKNREKLENQECAQMISPVEARFHLKILIESRKLALVLPSIMQHKICVTIVFVQLDCAVLGRKMSKISPDKWLPGEPKLEYLPAIFLSWSNGQSDSKELVCEI